MYCLPVLIPCIIYTCPSLERLLLSNSCSSCSLQAFGRWWSSLLRTPSERSARWDHTRDRPSLMPICLLWTYMPQLNVAWFRILLYIMYARVWALCVSDLFVSTLSVETKTVAAYVYSRCALFTILHEGITHCQGVRAHNRFLGHNRSNFVVAALCVMCWWTRFTFERSIAPWRILKRRLNRVSYW